MPEADWFALLHASARPQPALSAEVAVALVLHALSPGWARHPAACRHAALRLFLADGGDLRGDLQRLCAALPAGWGPADRAPARVRRRRQSRPAGVRRCFGALRKVRFLSQGAPGGLALLGGRPAGPASPEEVGALFRNAGKYGGIGGFRKLLSLL